MSVLFYNLSKHDDDGSENFIWKCNFAFLQLSSNYSKSLCLKNVFWLSWNKIGTSAWGIRRQNEHLSSYAIVVHTTAKQVISRRRKNENVFKMSENEKCTCKACTNTVFHCERCKFVGFLLPSSSLSRRWQRFGRAIEILLPFIQGVQISVIVNINVAGVTKNVNKYKFYSTSNIQICFSWGYTLWNKICAKDHVLQAAWLLTKKSSVYSFNVLLRCEYFLPLLPQFPLPHNLHEIYEQKCRKKRYRKKNSAFPPEISLQIFQTSVWQLMDVRGTG